MISKIPMIDMTVVKVDVEGAGMSELVHKLQIRSMPAFHFYKTRVQLTWSISSFEVKTPTIEGPAYW